MELYHLEEYIERLKSTPATLLWEYGFEFNDSFFKNFNEIINNPNLLPLEENLVITLYLYYIAVEKYREGTFWQYTEYIENDAQTHKEVYEKFNTIIKEFNLFPNKLSKGSYRYVSHILIHAVLPKYYAEEFLTIVNKIYEKYDDLEYLYFISQKDLINFFKNSLKFYKELIKNKETINIFKDLIYRTAKTLEDESSKNIYNLPEWFFEKILLFKSKINFKAKKTFFEFDDKNNIKLNYKLKNNLYFIDSYKKNIYFEIDKEKNTIFVARNPFYIIINKNEYPDIIEDLEENFSIYQYQITNYPNYSLHEIAENLIGDYLGNFEIEELKDNFKKLNIEIKSIKQEFPKELIPEDGIDTFFEGIEIINFDKFKEVYFNNKKIDTSHPILPPGDYNIRAITKLGEKVKNKKIRILPFYDIQILPNKIKIENKEFGLSEKINLNGNIYTINLLDITIIHIQQKKEANLILFRELNNYKIKIKNRPNHIKKLKIIYEDNENKIIDTKIIPKKYNYIEITKEINNNSNFPIKIYYEYQFPKYQKELIATIYYLEVNEKDKFIEIKPELREKLKIVIQSISDPFQKPKSVNSFKIFYNEFPEPKFGDFNIAIYDKVTNELIFTKIVSNNTKKLISSCKNKIISYFLDNVISLRKLMLKNREIKELFKKIKNINYHYLTEEVNWKLNNLIDYLTENYFDLIDNLLIELNNSNIPIFIKLKYYILFNKSFKINFIDKIFLEESILLFFRIKFKSEIPFNLKPDQIFSYFLKNILSDKSKYKNYKKEIFEVLEFDEVKNLINKSKLELINET